MWERVGGGMSVFVAVWGIDSRFQIRDRVSSVGVERVL